MEKEIWKPVIGYEGFYEVSDWGRVKSLNYNRTCKEGIMKPNPVAGGYLQVDLSKNGEKEKFLVHILVMRAFIGECPEGYEVDHYDWNPENNKLENLSYQPKGVNRARHSPEWYEKMNKMYQDPEWRKNHAEALRRLAQDPEWLRKNAEAVKKRSQDPEWQRKNAEKNRRLAQDPAWREKSTKILQNKTPDWRKNNAEAIRKRCCKPVNQYTIDGEFVKTWESAADAARELGVYNQNISKCCKGKYKSTGGFIWKFAV